MKPYLLNSSYHHTRKYKGIMIMFPALLPFGEEAG